MGRATITGGGADGSYQIMLDYGTVARQDKVMALTNTIAALSTKITEAQGAFDAEKAKVDAAAMLVSEAIEAYVLATKASDNPSDWKDELAVFQARQAAHLAAQGKAEPLRIKMGELKAEKAQAVKDKGYWESVELEATQQAWCVDLTEDASGEVGTVDVLGESAQILIVPGGAPPSAQDGALTAREVQRGDQVYFNSAILPGWQKFKPTYRIGVIDALNMDADTADVTLVPATSSAQGLNINRYTSLPDTPINYMTCNAGAFEVGDRVVVQFDDGQWNSPRVIGFESNPKPCLPEYVEFDWLLSYGPWLGGSSREIFKQVVDATLRRFFYSPPALFPYSEAAGTYLSTTSERYTILSGERSIDVILSPYFYPSEVIDGVDVNVANPSIWSGVEGVGSNGGARNFSPANPYEYRMFGGKRMQRFVGYEVSGVVAYAGGVDIVVEVPDVTAINVPLGPETADVVVAGLAGLIGTGVFSVDFPIPEFEDIIGPSIGDWESMTSPPGTVEVTRGSVSVNYTFDGWHDTGSSYVMRYRRPGSAP